MKREKKNLEGHEPYPVPEFSRGDFIRLDMNENLAGCSPRVLSALREASVDDVSFYPDYSKFREKLAQSCKLKKENILLTCGGDEGIRCTLEAFVEDGEEVIMPFPTYAMFPILARLQGVQIKEVPFARDRLFPKKTIINAISEKTKGIIVVNPASPTGLLVKQEDLEQLLADYPEIMVFLDETYCHYSKTSLIHLVEKYPQLVVIRTFSKAQGLAGLRLGYVASAGENIVSMSKVAFPYGASSLAVKAGLAALEDDDFTRKVVEDTDKEKERLQSSLEKIGIKVLPTDTNFLLLEVGENEERIYKELFQRKILVRRLSGPPLEGFLRVTVGIRKENDAFLQAMQEIRLLGR